MVKVQTKSKKSSRVLKSIARMGRKYSRSTSEPGTYRSAQHQRRQRRIKSVPTDVKIIHWMSFLVGFQRVVVFIDDPICAREMRRVGHYLFNSVVL